MNSYPSSSKGTSTVSMAVCVITNFGVIFNDNRIFSKKLTTENTEKIVYQVIRKSGYRITGEQENRNSLRWQGNIEYPPQGVLWRTRNIE
jgi:hypothetical protein